jgi:serine/threonine protein kinase
MPYLPGQSLAARLKRGPLELPEALWIARQTAEGLAALHAHGWLHGDVTPGNVLVSPRGQATLIDLGFARPLGEPISALDRVVAGTPHYLAPELIFSVQPADVRSDLFSLGVMLFEMLSGVAPAQGDTLEDMARAHREGSSRRLRSLAPDTPQPVATLVERLLARQPLRRPNGAAEVVEQLFEFEVRSFGQRRRA